MADYILCLIVKFEAAVFRLLPLRFSLWVGRRFGDIFYCLIGKRRSVAYANLKAAFRGRYTPSQLNRIIRQVYQNIAQSYIELVKFPQLGEGYIKKYMKIEGDEKVRRSLEEEKKGVILLTAHFGNWEISSLAGSIEGFKMNVLARMQKLERLNGYLNEIRGSKGANVIFKEDAKEEIMRALANNEVVGILSDQDGGKRGEFVDFFGRKASTPKGVAQFSLRTGAPVFPVFIIREKGPYHRIIVEDDISVLESYDVKKDIHEILQRFAGLLQKYVDKYPGQWLWLHKRWKSTPTKYILVLSDGKAGHLKQSSALANMIKKQRIESGCDERDTIIETLEVRFKTKWLRAIFEIGVSAGFSLHQVSFCFPKNIYDNINAAYADYVISCGSSLAGVNLALKREFGARSVVIMRPNIHKLKGYDLAVIPAHDRIKARPNVVFTKGTVTGLDREKVSEYAGSLKERVNVTNDKIIGVLIGGDSKAYTLEPELMTVVLEEVLRAADELNAQILVTTSRRSSKALESAVKARLGDSKRVRLLLIANQDNFSGAIEGILGLSDILIVSGESIAMVTEAISSGKKVAVFMPRKRRPFLGTKQETAIGNLEKEGLLKVSKPSDLKGTICDLIKKEVPSNALEEDASALKAAVKKII